MLCLKKRTKHRLELSGFFDLVTTGENFKNEIRLLCERKGKKQANPYKDWPDLSTNPKLSGYIIPHIGNFWKSRLDQSDRVSQEGGLGAFDLVKALIKAKLPRGVLSEVSYAQIGRPEIKPAAWLELA